MSDIFALRRKQLFSMLGPNAAVVLEGASIQYRTDAYYRFSQDRDFYYLTGFDEPEAMALMTSDQKGEICFTLFNLPKDPAKECWEGIRVGQKEALGKYGADEAFPIEQAFVVLTKRLKDHRHCFTMLKNSGFQEQALGKWLTENTHLQDISPYVHQMRLVKDEEEIPLLRKAAQISAEAHTVLMQQVRPGMLEMALEGIFINYCLKHGVREMAYPCIVGSGPNSCILHHNKNNRVMQDGEVVLVDAGGEYRYYASDITRTFPVSKNFSSPQKAIYSLVLEAQMAGIALIKPGVPFAAIQQVILEVLVQGLIDLKILKGSIEANIEKKAYFPYYMHNSGHWIGLYVHDVGGYKENNASTPLAKHMALTIEPGLYLSDTDHNIPKAFRGIGVRIEDDILVTETGCEVLSEKAPKTIDAIEQLKT